MREGVLEWWDQAMQTRLNDPRTGAFVIIMQRVHEQDLTGHILANELGEEWDHLIYAQQWSSVASEIEATELHCTKPTAGGDEDTAHGRRSAPANLSIGGELD